MKNHAFGISKTVNKLIDNLIEYPSLYAILLTFTSKQREYFKAKISKIIKSELLGDEFKRALAKDILNNGEIQVDTEVFKYLKRVVYKGDLRGMLSDLQSILEKE